MEDLTGWISRNIETIIVSIVISTLVSHHFSVLRDRRKEINEAADALASKIYISADDASVQFTQHAIDTYVRRVGRLRRWRFLKALQTYRHERDKQHYEYGKMIDPGDPEAIVAAAVRLSKLLTRI